MPDHRLPRTITWSGTLTAVSSIAHGGETRGTITLLRREIVTQPSGQLMYLPVISGNTLRGRLRRLGEELLRDELRYEGLLSPATAHALRGGGALAKTSHEPLTGSRLQSLRSLVPQIAVFGAAGGGTIINGALDVGKVVPHVVESNHITGAHATLSAFSATQLEAYARQDDAAGHDFADVLAASTTAEMRFDTQGRPDPRQSSGSQMQFHVETFPAGTVFSTWLRLRRPTGIEVDFMLDVLDAFASDGRLGGRVGVGHGQIQAALTAEPEPVRSDSWRELVRDRRNEILTALEALA
jgi:hypothetical protein